ncbi:MAG: ATP-binding cassette domain-containing protein, partial [Treponema sp.]|nr:ATP-binding cassette domain-containing protein [Treponema sp.]
PGSVFRNRMIGFVSQEQSFLENLTVLDNVRLPACIGKKSPPEESTSRAESLLAELGIGQLASCYPAELSGGENHRVLIARALMNDPPVLLADEPTASLEREQADSVMGLFRSLADTGKSIVVVSHDEQVLRSCDEVLRI